MKLEDKVSLSRKCIGLHFNQKLHGHYITCYTYILVICCRIVVCHGSILFLSIVFFFNFPRHSSFKVRYSESSARWHTDVVTWHPAASRCQMRRQDGDDEDDSITECRKIMQPRSTQTSDRAFKHKAECYHPVSEYCRVPGGLLKTK